MKTHLVMAFAVAALLAGAPSASATVLADCPNTVRLANACDTYVAPPRGPLFIADANKGGSVSVLYAPSEADDPTYRAAIASFIGGTVDYYDARAGTPDVPTLSGYDAVITWANGAYADRDGFGNNLASYADGGGKVILSVFTTYDNGNSLGGAIRGAAYSPVANPTGTNHFSSDTWAGDGSLFYSGVSSLECLFRDYLVPQGAGAQDGTYTDDEILGAYRNDIDVLYMNGDGHVGLSCSGDWAQLAANMILAGGSPPAPNFDIAINTHGAAMRGGSVFFRGPVTNTGGATGSVYVYFTYSVPGVGTFKKNLGQVTLGPGQSFNYKNFPKSKNYVPLTMDAPAGMYTVTVYAASDKNGTTIYDTDSFSFTLPPLPYLAETAGLPGASNLETVEPRAVPNPFRDATSITYAVAEDAPVDLRVFDVTGRQVSALVNGTQSAGVHTATLRAGDLPSGIYVWRLTVGGEVTTGRITLAR